VGKRGPLTGNLHGLKSGPAVQRTPSGQKSRAVSTRATPATLPALRVVIDPNSPPAPADLPSAAVELWDDLAGVVPFRHDRLDAPMLERFCRLTVERQQYQTALDALGLVLEEAQITPTGAVVGQRIVLNPLIPALRAIDRALDSVSDRLGLSPVSRARLGLTVSNALAAEATAERILGDLNGD
jgi:P27 family predicted phage terminase small subunit